MKFFSLKEHAITQNLDKVNAEQIITFTEKYIRLGLGNKHILYKNSIKFIQEKEPNSLECLEGDIWFNPKTKTFYEFIFNAEAHKFEWVEAPDLYPKIQSSLEKALKKYLCITSINSFIKYGVDERIASAVITLQNPNGFYKTFGIRGFKLLGKNGADVGNATKIVVKAQSLTGLINYDVYYDQVKTIMDFKTTAGCYSTDYLPKIFGYGNTSYGWLGRQNTLSSATSRVIVNITFNEPNELIKGISFINGTSNTSYGSTRTCNIELYNIKGELLGYNYEPRVRNTTQACLVGDALE